MPNREAYAELPSTQDRAVQLAREGAPAGTRVVARSQTAGRGRLDHPWLSPPGGLYLSIVLAAPDAPSLLPLALGARILARFREAYGLPGALKWPNDLYVAPPGGRGLKLGGLLVDRVPSPTLGSAAVAGIGINVSFPRSAVPAELSGRIGALDDFVRPPPDLGELEREVAAAVEGAAVALGSADGLAAARRLCRGYLYGVGRWATVDGRLRGRIAGLGDDGELFLDVGAERVAIRAGDLRVEDER